MDISLKDIAGAIGSVVAAFIGGFAGAWAERRQAKRRHKERARELLAEFERDAFKMPSGVEKAASMYRSIRECKENLQAKGATLLPLPDLAAEFRGAIDAIRVMLQSVDHQFTDVTQLASQAGPITPAQESVLQGRMQKARPGSYTTAINLMMGVRPAIESAKKAIDRLTQ
jgi:hypothetical protein